MSVLSLSRLVMPVIAMLASFAYQRFFIAAGKEPNHETTQ